MKEYKQYLLRGTENSEAVAVIEVPSRFDFSSLRDGKVTDLSVGIYSKDPTMTYNFEGTGKNDVNHIRKLEMEMSLRKEHHELIQPVTLEEITESYFETVKEFGLIWLITTGFNFTSSISTRHKFQMKEVLPPTLPRSDKPVQYWKRWFSS